MNQGRRGVPLEQFCYSDDGQSVSMMSKDGLSENLDELVQYLVNAVFTAP